MPVRQLTAPVFEPVTIAEVKAQIRLGTSDEDSLLAVLIQAARQSGEHLTGRAFVERSFRLSLSGFPGRVGRVSLPKPPLVEVQSVSFTVDGETTVMLPSEYRVISDSDQSCAYLLPAEGELWPETDSEPGSVVVDYTSGWPLDDEDVPTTPEAVKLWVLRRVADLYAMRETFNVQSGQNLVILPHSHVDGLLDPYIVWS